MPRTPPIVIPPLADDATEIPVPGGFRSVRIHALASEPDSGEQVELGKDVIRVGPDKPPEVLRSVRVGDDTYAYEHFDAVIDDDSRALIVTIRVRMRDGRPWCTELAVRPVSGDVDKAMLRDLPLRSYIDAAVIEASYRPGSGGPLNVWARGGTIDVRRRKRRLDDDYLREVAQIYREATKNPTATVERELGLSRSTAGHHVQLARRRGFLGQALAERTAGESPPAKRGAPQ